MAPVNTGMDLGKCEVFLNQLSDYKLRRTVSNGGGYMSSSSQSYEDNDVLSSRPSHKQTPGIVVSSVERKWTGLSPSSSRRL